MATTQELSSYVTGLSTASLVGTEEVYLSSDEKTTVQDIANLAAAGNLGNSNLVADAATRTYSLAGDLFSDKLSFLNYSSDTIIDLKGDKTVSIPFGLGVGTDTTGADSILINASGKAWAVKTSAGGSSGHFYAETVDGSTGFRSFIYNGARGHYTTLVNNAIGYDVVVNAQNFQTTGGIGYNAFMLVDSAEDLDGIKLQINNNGAGEGNAINVVSGDIKTDQTVRRILSGAGTHVTRLGGNIATDIWEVQTGFGTPTLRVYGTGVVSIGSTLATNTGLTVRRGLSVAIDAAPQNMSSSPIAFKTAMVSTGTTKGLSAVITGAGTKYGAELSCTGTGTNYALYANASGGTTNYAIYAQAGDIRLSDSSGKIGVLGASPIVQQLFPTGAGKTVDELITVLQNFGFLKQS